MQLRPRWQTRLVAVLVGLPVYAILGFYLFVVGWRLHLGRWPRYASPDAGAFQGLALWLDIFVFVWLRYDDGVEGEIDLSEVRWARGLRGVG